MLSPVSSAQPSQASQAVKPAAPQTPQAQQKSAPQQSDTVTLKSTGDADHDGDSA